MLSVVEVEWLNSYHLQVWEKVSIQEDLFCSSSDDVCYVLYKMSTILFFFLIKKNEQKPHLTTKWGLYSMQRKPCAITLHCNLEYHRVQVMLLRRSSSLVLLAYDSSYAVIVLSSALG